MSISPDFPNLLIIMLIPILGIMIGMLAVYFEHKEKMKLIGENALEFFENFINEKNTNKYSYRAISGIISLKDKYGEDVVDKACLRANKYGVYKYKVVKNICEKDTFNLDLDKNDSYINVNETYLSRDLSMYSKLEELGELKK